MYKRVVSLILAALMLASCTVAGAASLSKAEVYDAALRELKDYLNDTSSISPDRLYEAFSGLGSYEYSAELSIYTQVLQNLQNNSFDQNETLISYLRLNGAFCAYVQGDEALGSVDALEWYAKGRRAEAAGEVETAVSCYQKSVPFMDSFQRMVRAQAGREEYYALAQQNLAEGKKRSAFYNFLRAGDYKDAIVQARMCGDCILDGSDGAFAAIDSTGRVITLNGVADASGLEDIEFIETETRCWLIIGLDGDGKTKKAMIESRYYGPKYPDEVLAGMKSCQIKNYDYAVTYTDGTVRVVNIKNDLIEERLPWEGIVDTVISERGYVGLTKTGRIVTAEHIYKDDYYDGFSATQVQELETWTDIIDIEAGLSTICGLRKDGTVASLELYIDPKENPEVAAWRNIAAIEVNEDGVVFGLKTDGTVVVADEDGSVYDFDENEIAQWKDIVAIAANIEVIIGMKSDGALVVAGSGDIKKWWADRLSEITSELSTWDLLVD